MSDYLSVLYTGWALNILLIIIVLLKRYIPILLHKRRMKGIEQQGKKLVKFKPESTMNPISIVLIMTCIVLILIPYIFTLFVILSIKPAREFRDDLR